MGGNRIGGTNLHCNSVVVPPHNRCVRCSQSLELVVTDPAHTDHTSPSLHECVLRMPWLRVSADHHATLGRACSFLYSSHTTKYSFFT